MPKNEIVYVSFILEMKEQTIYFSGLNTVRVLARIAMMHTVR